MNKTSWTLLALSLVILTSAVFMFLSPGKKQQDPPPLNWAKTDPLFAAVHSSNYALVEKIVKKKPHILKEYHTMGGTYINCAASSNNTKMMKLILKLGGDPNFGARCGTTPIIVATKQGNPAMIKILLEAGANPNVFSEGSCPLTTAKRSKYTEIVKLLEKYHAKEVVVGPNGIMPKKAKP